MRMYFGKKRKLSMLMNEIKIELALAREPDTETEVFSDRNSHLRKAEQLITELEAFTLELMET